MLPNMRFYIISVVSIFAALGIGIFIGFTINAQYFIIEQNQIINDIMEKQFQTLIDENRDLKYHVSLLENENKQKDEFIDLSYFYLVNNRLEGLKIGIIETTEDYSTSGIEKDLELAGATILNITSIKDNITDKDQLNTIYKTIRENIPKNPVETSISELIQSIIVGKINSTFESLNKEDFVRAIGTYNEPIDYIVLCGGSIKDSSKKINQVDKVIINTAKKYNIPIIGVEKAMVEYSYINSYQDIGISTVDNIDMTMGRIAMVLAMEGFPGNFGIKDTAESVIPIGLKY